MFGKLLKHDFRASWPLLGTLSLICLGAGATGALVIRTLDTDPKDFVMWLCIMGMFAVTLYLVGYTLASGFVLLGRFYKSRFTDEGYLTFTLPVTTHQVLLSSFLNCGLGMLLSFLVTFVSVGIMGMFGLTDLDGHRWEFIRLAVETIGRVLRELSVQTYGTILLALLAVLARLCMMLITIMLSMTVGAVIAKKHKILAAIACYYGIQMVMSLPSGIAIVSSAVAAVDSAIEATMVNFFGFVLAESVVVSLACYFLMHYLVKRKLNLN